LSLFLPVSVLNSGIQVELTGHDNGVWNGCATETISRILGDDANPYHSRQSQLNLAVSDLVRRNTAVHHAVKSLYTQDDIKSLNPSGYTRMAEVEMEIESTTVRNGTVLHVSLALLYYLISASSFQWPP
jgi:hypothetical protein